MDLQIEYTSTAYLLSFKSAEYSIWARRCRGMQSRRKCETLFQVGGERKNGAVRVVMQRDEEETKFLALSRPMYNPFSVKL